MNIIQQTTLHFQSGNSDKIYEVDLVELDTSSYLVNFRYGRRNSTLKEGSKTTVPVSREKAEKLYKSLVVSKINKGYTVSKGINPLQTSPPQAAPRPLDPTTLAQRICERLTLFAQGKKHITSYGADGKTGYIHGHSLSRTVWAAGQYQVTEAAPLLSPFIAPKQEVLNFSLAWTLGQLKQPESLTDLGKLEEYLPPKMRYIAREARLNILTPEAKASYLEALIQGFPQVSLEELGTLNQSLGEFTYLESLYCQELDANALKKTRAFLDKRDCLSAVETALSAPNLLQTSFDDFYANLPEQTLAHIAQAQALQTQLKNAVLALKDHRLYEFIAELEKDKNKDMGLYNKALDTLNLKQILDEYSIPHARAGYLSWLWGQAKNTLLNKLENTGLFQDFKSFTKRLGTYESLRYLNVTPLDEATRQTHLALLEAHNLRSEIEPVLKKATFKRLQHWNFFQDFLPDSIYSALFKNVSRHILELFEHQLHQLKSEKLAQKDLMLKRYEQGVLGFYYQTYHREEAPQQWHAFLQHWRLHRDNFRLFRKLYKLAEFHQDPQSLALLNAKLEFSSPLSSTSYWNKNIQHGCPAATHLYFRKRMVRTLKHLGKVSGSDYCALATAILLEASDTWENQAPEIKSGSIWKQVGGTWREVHYTHHYPAFSRHLALNHILHAHSTKHRPNRSYSRWRDTQPQTHEPETTEAHPEHWQSHPECLLKLALGAQAEKVNDFALKKLKLQPEFSAQIALPELLRLVQRPYENTALWALDLLKPNLEQTDVLIALLRSPFEPVRQVALGHCTSDLLRQHPALFVTLLLSLEPDLQAFIHEHLELMSTVARPVTALLLAHIAQHDLDAELQGYLEGFFKGPLKGQGELEILRELLNADSLEKRILAATILSYSDLSYEALHPLLEPLKTSAHPALQACALRLFGKLPMSERRQQGALIFSALLSPESELRQAALDILSPAPELHAACFEFVLPHLFKKEPFEGLLKDLSQLLKQMNSLNIDADVLWRLLQAQSKMAQQAGAILLSHHPVHAFSQKQWALLLHNPALAVRKRAFQELSSAQAQALDWLVQGTETPWEDTRRVLLDHFQTLADEHWPPKRLIALADSVYADVQHWALQKIQTLFESEHALYYLTTMSQHPSANVQLFVSGLLQAHAGGQPELILSLLPFYKEALLKVNQGRVLKDRIIRFLFEEAHKNTEVAHMVLRLFSEQVYTEVIADKTHYIHALFELQQGNPEQSTPLTLIAPERRVYS